MKIFIAVFFAILAAAAVIAGAVSYSNQRSAKIAEWRKIATDWGDLAERAALSDSPDRAKRVAHYKAQLADWLQREKRPEIRAEITAQIDRCDDILAVMAKNGIR